MESGYAEKRDKLVSDYAAGDPRLDSRRKDDLPEEVFVPQSVSGPDATLESQAAHAEQCAKDAKDDGEKFRLGEVAKAARKRVAGPETASASPGEGRTRSVPVKGKEGS